MKNFLLTPIALAFLISPLFAKSLSESIPVNVTVTAEPMQGTRAPVVTREDVTAYKDHDQVKVAGWTPAGASALQLFILIDDASSTELGTQLNDIRHFIQSQAPETQTGVAYMHDGMADVLQSPTTGHAAAAKVLRLPFGVGAGGASPYLALSDLIHKWKLTDARREVVMISSGIDPLGGPPPVDPYLETAIHQAQRAGIVVYSIYTPHAGYYGRDFWRVYWGQNYLSELSENTGGDSFMLGYAPPVSFAPYFEEIDQRIANQYRATLLMRPDSGGNFQPIRLFARDAAAELVTQTSVYFNAGI